MAERDFGRLARAPAYRLVYDAIEREIMAGKLRVGDLLPPETQLAQQFRVNRSTVREGIRILEQSGLVEREGGKRPRIAAPDFTDLASSTTRALLLQAATFRELWEASMAVEPGLAEAAADRITDAELAALDANLAEMEAAIQRIEAKASDVDEFVVLDRAFHDLLAQASRNRVLILAHEPLSKLLLAAGRLVLPRLNTYGRVLDAHRYIVEALKHRDAGDTRKWMRLHMHDFRRGFEQVGLDLDTVLDASRLGLAD